MSSRIKIVKASETAAVNTSTISKLAGVGSMSSSIEIDGSGAASEVLGLMAKATLVGAGAD